jgi:hypothetical protein
MANATPTPATPGIIFPQDYALKSLTLLTPAQTFDIKASTIELCYYEDIFSSTTSGHLSMSDASGYLNKLRFNGNEFIRIIFGKTKSNINNIDAIFRVYKIGNRTLDNNMQSEVYTLYFCSEEMILNEQYKIQKSYPKKKISEIIDNICSEYLGIDSSNYTIEDTYGTYDFIIPNFKPFEAINWLSTYARSASGNPGADMLFFQNKDGFHFLSLQTLFANTPYNTYNVRPQNIGKKQESLSDKVLTDVLSYTILDSFDVLSGINQGIFANRFVGIDPLLQRYEITDFNYIGGNTDYANKAQNLNGNPIINNYQNRFGDEIYKTSEAVVKMSIVNSGQQLIDYIKNKVGSVAQDIYAETYIPYRTAQLALANYHRVRLSIPGDPEVKVGMVITFNLPSTEFRVNDEVRKTLDSFYSGNYLVTAVKQFINPNSNGYTTEIEITKESVPNQIGTIDNTSTIWKNSSKGKTQ